MAHGKMWSVLRKHQHRIAQRYKGSDCGRQLRALGSQFIPPRGREEKRKTGKRNHRHKVQTKEEPLPPASSQSIPTFYFPRGRPQGTVNVDAVIAKIERTFAQFPHERATMEDMGKVAKVFSSFGQTPRSVTAASYGDHHLEGDVHHLWRPFVHLKTPSHAPKV
nr:serine/threonine-protein phosphatase 2A regulatory subunit B'' subunit delta-like isoform X3 [Equus asinus]